VYSTCTLNPHENQANAVRFLEEHPSFEPVPLEIEARRLIDEPDNMITLFPNVNQCDGFFIAKFRRIK
jgi:16S rRNA (cytosine967-C5)-methyltransferase